MTEIVQYDDKTPKRTTLQIEKDMDATRERLVGTISELEQRVKPANLIKDQRSKIENKVNAFYKNDEGSVRYERVAMTAAAAVASVLALRLTSRSVRWVFGAPRQASRKPQLVYVPVPTPTPVAALPAA